MTTSPARTITTTATKPVMGLFFPFPAGRNASNRQPPTRQPLSARMIGFVLQHADMETDIGGGRVELGFSQKLINSDAMRARFGFRIGALRRARVIWNPATGAVLGMRG